MSAAFFREYLRNWRTVGAVAPSSPALARRMMEAGGVAQARNVLELGPGTGAFTAAIDATLPRQAGYLGLELNADFVANLRRQFPHFRFEAAAAQEFDFASQLGPDVRFDVIISGLPWAAFPPGLQKAILDHVLPRLAPGGCFATFAYWGFHWMSGGRKFRSLLQERLPHLTTSPVVWGNIPPAFVYLARREVEV